MAAAVLMIILTLLGLLLNGCDPGPGDITIGPKDDICEVDMTSRQANSGFRIVAELKCDGPAFTKCFTVTKLSCGKEKFSIVPLGSPESPRNVSLTAQFFSPDLCPQGQECRTESWDDATDGWLDGRNLQGGEACPETIRCYKVTETKALIGEFGVDGCPGGNWCIADCNTELKAAGHLWDIPTMKAAGCDVYRGDAGKPDA